MSQSSLQVANEQYCAEFPFIREWLEQSQRSTLITVERLDLDVLADRAYSQRFYIGDAGVAIPVDGTGRFFLIGKDGSTIDSARQRRKDYSGRSLLNPLTWFGRWVDAETVQELLLRQTQNSLKKLGYVVAVRQNSDYHDRITVYKLPKSFCLADFVEAERQRIQQVVRGVVG